MRFNGPARANNPKDLLSDLKVMRVMIKSALTSSTNSSGSSNGGSGRAVAAATEVATGRGRAAASAWVQAVHNQNLVPLALAALQRQLAQAHACGVGARAGRGERHGCDRHADLRRYDGGDVRDLVARRLSHGGCQ